MTEDEREWKELQDLSYEKIYDDLVSNRFDEVMDYIFDRDIERFVEIIHNLFVSNYTFSNKTMYLTNDLCNLIEENVQFKAKLEKAKLDEEQQERIDD